MVSAAGVVGAAIGFYIGWIDYRLGCGFLRSWADKTNKDAASPMVVWLLRNGALLEKLLLVVTLLGFPAIGYLAGASLAG